MFNLIAWFRLATFGEKLALDVWNYVTADGRGIQNGLDFLLPYSLGTGWPYGEIAGREYGAYYDLLQQAAVHYPDTGYKGTSHLLPLSNAERRRIHLLL